jgi:hypothetical protein
MTSKIRKSLRGYQLQQDFEVRRSNIGEAERKRLEEEAAKARAEAEKNKPVANVGIDLGSIDQSTVALYRSDNGAWQAQVNADGEITGLRTATPETIAIGLTEIRDNTENTRAAPALNLGGALNRLGETMRGAASIMGSSMVGAVSQSGEVERYRAMQSAHIENITSNAYAVHAIRANVNPTVIPVTYGHGGGFHQPSIQISVPEERLEASGMTNVLADLLSCDSSTRAHVESMIVHVGLPTGLQRHAEPRNRTVVLSMPRTPMILTIVGYGTPDGILREAVARADRINGETRGTAANAALRQAEARTDRFGGRVTDCYPLVIAGRKFYIVTRYTMVMTNNTRTVGIIERRGDSGHVLAVAEDLQSIASTAPFNANRSMEDALGQTIINLREHSQNPRRDVEDDPTHGGRVRPI